KCGNVVGARETVGSSMVQKSGIQCYNCKEFGHVAKECQKLKRAKDAAYHREKMLLLDMSYDSEQIDQNDEDADLAKEQLLEKCKGLETDLSKSQMMSKRFESIHKHAINLELELQQCKENINNDMSFKLNKSKDFYKEHEQYFEIQDLKAQLQDKGIPISVILSTSVSRPQLKSNPMEDRVLRHNSHGKKQELEYNRRNVKLAKNKTSVTASHRDCSIHRRLWVLKAHNEKSQASN
nr:hypothetical protein [Tanacetum cinerariifolium]